MKDELEATCCLCGGAIDTAVADPCAARVQTEDGETEEWLWHSRCFGDAGPERIPLLPRE
jgi:hypothetical protein